MPAVTAMSRMRYRSIRASSLPPTCSMLTTCSHAPPYQYSPFSHLPPQHVSETLQTQPVRSTFHKAHHKKKQRVHLRTSSAVQPRPPLSSTHLYTMSHIKTRRSTDSKGAAKCANLLSEIEHSIQKYALRRLEGTTGMHALRVW